MFADAVETVLHSTLNPHAAPGCKIYSAGEKVQERKDGLLASSLERLEGVHLLPCLTKYNGPASVSELFQPQEPSASNHQADRSLMVLFHGRLLMGQQQSLSCSLQKVPLQGFVVAPHETKCTFNDLRKSLTAGNPGKQEDEDECAEVEEPPAAITELRPCAQFDKLCYWNQDREPTVTDDVQQSLFFLRAVTALHDYEEEHAEFVDEEDAR